MGDPRVAHQLSTAFSPGCDHGVPGSSPTLGSLHGACYSLCLCLCLSLSLSVSHINKYFEKKKRKSILYVLSERVIKQHICIFCLYF